MPPRRTLTVATYFAVEIDVEAESEARAIMNAGPQIEKVEERLAELGYTFQMEQVRVRRPRTSVKAAEREAAKREGRVQS